MNQTPQRLLEYLSAIGAPMVSAHRPWPRFRLTRAQWTALIDHMALLDWSLVGLWAERTAVHLCLRDDKTMDIAVMSLDCPEGNFPSVSPARPSAQRLERTIRDLFGLEPEGFDDRRSWLDHGAWAVAGPMSAAPLARAPGPSSAHYEFLPVEGEGLHQIPVGPVHAGIIEPGHFRFHCNGEAVARLEERLGYVHKGVEKLVEGKALTEAIGIVSRLSGDATVAYGLAFARAAEAALGVEAPPRAHGLRAVMAEMERIANHLGDIGAICNDAAFSFMLAHCGALKEKVLRAAHALFGHRLMMDRIIPGGVTVDLTAEGGGSLVELSKDIERRLDELTDIYDDKPSLLDRTKETGFVAHHLVTRFGAGGHVGRASGRGQDARRSPGYPPYDGLEFAVPKLASGDVAARLWVRVEEVHASLGIIRQIVESLPSGPLAIDMPMASGEGMALVESFRGEILLWLRLDGNGAVARCHPRDPSWFQWPLLEAAIEGNIVADFPLCNKSFNCSYSGHDL